MFYITISNGLLTSEHRQKMGSSVWEYMWCIDKVTKIDDEGFGWVLGGKPIKLRDVGMLADNAVSHNLAKLEQGGYIKMTRTPYGIVIKVCKAKKRFNQNSESPKTVNHSNKKSPSKNSESPSQNRGSNKTVSIDSTVDITSRFASNKKKLMNTYDENRSSDSYDKVVDVETGDVTTPNSPLKGYGASMKELLIWSEKRRGSKFVNVVKQYTAMKKARNAKINPGTLKKRWMEMEDSSFWSDKGFDWTSVVSSFDKKR